MTHWDGHRRIAENAGPAPRRPHVGRRFFGAAAEASLITLLMFGLIAGSTLAAPGGHGNGHGGEKWTGTIALVMLADANGDGNPNYMDEVTFDVSTTATDMPMVGLRCWQGSNFVHDGYIALYDASWLVKYFRLSSSYWDPATTAICTARLFYYDNRSRERILATMDLVVAP